MSFTHNNRIFSKNKESRRGSSCTGTRKPSMHRRLHTGRINAERFCLIGNKKTACSFILGCLCIACIVFLCVFMQPIYLRSDTVIPDGAVHYEAGTYLCGSTIPSAEYVVFADGRSCYYRISSHEPADMYQIIYSGETTYNAIISVADGQYLTIENGFAVPLSDVLSLDTTKSGTFLANTHLSAGTYTIKPNLFSQDAYVEVISTTLYSPDHTNVVSSQAVSGKCEVTLSENEYLVLHNCHIL